MRAEHKPLAEDGAVRWRRTRSAGCIRSAGGSVLGAATPSTLVFLRGRDADARLCELAAERVAVRPVLGALAYAFVARRCHEALGYRSLGDHARERLGVGARTLREWARVSGALEKLPRLRAAFLSGELGFSVLRRVVALATPETDEACLASVRGRTLRAVEAMVRAARAASAAGADAPGAGAARATTTADEEDEREQERVRVRIACSEREATLWYAALELARRSAGEWLPAWRCAELVAAEASSVLEAADAESSARAGECERARASAPPSPRGADAESGEHGLRAEAFPALSWARAPAAADGAPAGLAMGVAAASPRELERRLRAAIAFLQSVDLEMGRVLRQMVDRRLFAELGFAGLERYAQERLDLAPRTARRLVSLARAERRAPALATAFRDGRIHALQACALARVATPDTAAAWVESAQRWSFRRLEEELEAAWLRGAAPSGAWIEFRAPRAVAELFLAMLERAGSLTRLLAVAIASWVEAGRAFRDYADFERDGFRCTAPGCTSRRNLHSHHVVLRSAGGSDEPGNRTTLCAFHHLRGVHGGALRIRGRAPDALVFELGERPPERFRSGDLRMT